MANQKKVKFVCCLNHLAMINTNNFAIEKTISSSNDTEHLDIYNKSECDVSETMTLKYFFYNILLVQQ